jgi:hypothetical protein
LRRSSVQPSLIRVQRRSAGIVLACCWQAKVLFLAQHPFKVLLAERTSDEEIQKTIAALSKCRNARMLEKVIRHRHFYRASLCQFDICILVPLHCDILTRGIAQLCNLALSSYLVYLMPTYDFEVYGLVVRKYREKILSVLVHWYWPPSTFPICSG